MKRFGTTLALLTAIVLLTATATASAGDRSARSRGRHDYRGYVAQHRHQVHREVFAARHGVPVRVHNRFDHCGVSHHVYNTVPPVYYYGYAPYGYSYAPQGTAIGISGRGFSFYLGL